MQGDAGLSRTSRLMLQANLRRAPFPRVSVPVIWAGHRSHPLICGPTSSVAVSMSMTSCRRVKAMAHSTRGWEEVERHGRSMNIHREPVRVWARRLLLLAIATLCSGAAGPPPATSCSSMFLDGQPPVALGKPGREAVLLCKGAYAVLVSPVTRDPVWSAEHLTTVQIMSAGMVSRHCRFRPDRDLEPGARAELDDYRHSGWDRGHMAPDADMPDEAAQRESCDLANAVPQAPRLNRGRWAHIEEDVRRLALFHGDVYVVTGPGFSAPLASIGPDKVLVPSWT